MTRYLPEPSVAQDARSAIGVLLINLGTPQAPTAQAVRTYLREFLSDPRVVEIWRPLWWLILNAFVLPTRPKRSAQRYAKIWEVEGSPLKIHSEKQVKLLRGFLGQRLKLPLVIDYAMRYGKPSISQTLVEFKSRGCDRVLMVPLYPQYAASTTASAFDAVAATLATMRNQPALRTVRDFHDDPYYIAALAQNVASYWTTNGRPDALVMSFHGLPRSTLDTGDPYHGQCLRTAQLLARALKLPQEQYHVTFQSRFGPAQWLKPYTSEVLNDLARRQVARVDVVCPGFVSDCLETLEEIASEGKALFLGAGGKEYRYIPCLNERDDWIHTLANIVARNLLGWSSQDSSDQGKSAS